MPKKPLLLIIPFFFLLMLLIVLDKPENHITLTLVVGQTGSLEGGFEPIYAEPNEKSDEIGKLEYNCAVVAAGNQTEEEWICVDLKKKGKGYVRAEAVDVEKLSLVSEDSVRQKLIEDAYSYLGLKFIRYGKSLTDGIDCSNFVSQIYAMQNIKISDRPKEQRDEGTVIPKKNMKPGDIIYYDKANNNTGHVGMYLGNGFIINSSGHSGRTYPEGGVRIVKLLYPDRTSYQVVRYLGQTKTEDTEVTGDNE